MKRYAVLLLAGMLLFSAQSSFAAVSVGYEALTVLPNAFVLYADDLAGGLGVKASADFGTSFISNLSSALASAFTFGLANPKISFMTLSVMKDINRSGDVRDYIRLGGFFVTAQSGAASVTKTMPTFGIGRDVSKFLNDKLVGNVELSFPEILTLGLRYKF